MKMKLLAIIGLLISAFPTFYFFLSMILIVGIYTLFTEQTWRISSSGHIWLNYRGGAVGFQPVLLIVSVLSTVFFFICLRVFLRERKKEKLEEKKSRDAQLAYTT